MAKNPFIKNAKLFAKSEDLYIMRQDDYIYLSEGHIIAKVAVSAYENFFRPISGVFIELSEGEKAEKRGKQVIPEKSPAVFDSAKCFKDCINVSCETVTASPFLMEYRDGKRTILHRMLTGINYYVSINNLFYELCEEMNITCFASKGSSNAPIIADKELYGIMILPIKTNQQVLFDFINVTK